MAWAELTGYIVYRWEFAILAAMDTAYCGALNNELSDKRSQQAEDAKQAAAKGKR